MPHRSWVRRFVFLENGVKWKLLRRTSAKVTWAGMCSFLLFASSKSLESPPIFLRHAGHTHSLCPGYYEESMQGLLRDIAVLDALLLLAERRIKELPLESLESLECL